MIVKAWLPVKLFVSVPIVKLEAVFVVPRLCFLVVGPDGIFTVALLPLAILTLSLSKGKNQRILLYAPPKTIAAPKIKEHDSITFILTVIFLLRFQPRNRMSSPRTS